MLLEAWDHFPRKVSPEVLTGKSAHTQREGRRVSKTRKDIIGVQAARHVQNTISRDRD